MSVNQNSHSGGFADQRVCMFSQRNFQGLVSRCNDYEFEDVVCTIDDVDLVAPQPYGIFPVGQKIANQFARHAHVASINPGIRKQTVSKNYDVFMMKCLFLRDLTSLNALKGWRQHCKTAVCWVMESWVSELHKFKGHLKILSQFDYVFINCSASVQPIQDIIQRPCSYIPPGIDAIQFTPYPDSPARCIDVFNLGRRSAVTHEALLKMAEQNKIFYIYDTINKLETSSPRQHRQLSANIAKRSRYFFANSGKIDMSSETNKQAEIGTRFFEGIAAGTVMLGDYPKTDAFRSNFDWPDAVIHMPFDADNIEEILADLDSQEERMDKVRKNNVIQSLLRHDWVYRWRAILDIVGLEPRPALISREKQLKELADKIQ